MKKFRMLRLVALLYRIFAWIVLIAGVLAGIAMIVMGVLGAAQPAVSPLIPGVAEAVGGILGGLIAIAAALIYFILLYAVSDVIHLGLAVEENTRMTAQLLRGEADMPPPPAPASWEETEG